MNLEALITQSDEFGDISSTSYLGSKDPNGDLEITIELRKSVSKVEAGISTEANSWSVGTLAFKSVRLRTQWVNKHAAQYFQAFYVELFGHCF